MKIINYKKEAIEELKRISNRTNSENNNKINLIVEEILQEVKISGDIAVEKYTKKFDGFDPDPMQVSADQIKNAWDDIDKNLKLIGIANTGKVFHIDWESNINNDYKLDNKSLGNIEPNEIINFHSIKKEIKNYLCILNSDGRFKKVLFDNDMIKSNRSFAVTKLKNNIKTVDSFISNEEKNLIILTSIGRIFKFNLSDEILTPTTKQSQGLILVKLLPTEKIVSCCPYQNEENIYLVSTKGKIFCINTNEIYYANEFSLGYLNEKTQLKNDSFLKVLPSNHYLDIETNKNKSARLNFDKLNFKSNKTNFLIDFLKLDQDEYIDNCFQLENFLD